MKPQYFQNNEGSSPKHLGFHFLLASPRHHGWQSVVCRRSKTGRQDMYGRRRRGRWMSLDIVVLGGGVGGSGGGGGE